MRKASVLGLLAFYCGSAFAVSMNFTGNFRTETLFYNKLNLGVPGTDNSKGFISARALLQPNLLIDDHFSLKSQWNLLTSPNFTPSAVTPLGQGQGGYVFGDPRTNALVLNRVWLEWTSDFGVLRIGRMPVAWGYGLIYDAGNNVWDNWQSTLDRVEYRLFLGHVIGALAYSKPRKLSVIGNSNDGEFYTAYLQYQNPEIDVEAGVMYEKQSRSTSQGSDLMGPANPFRVPLDINGNPTSNPTPLHLKSPYPISINLVDLYIKKTVGYFTFGGELGWTSGNGTDFNGDNTADSVNAIGAMVNGQFEYHSFKAFLDVIYAQGDNNLNANHQNGFVLLHRNRSPGLILGRELLGNYAGNNIQQGSMVVYGNSGSYSGVIYARPGIKYDWSPSISSGLEVIWAQKAATQGGESGSLGVEVDAGAEYSVYKDFDLGLNVGILFPGKGLQVNNPSTVFGARGTVSLKF